MRIKDQNFKGAALERVVRFRKSILPTKPCKARGEMRQIDAAFDMGDRLIIVECRAVNWSIGFDREQPEAIRFRIDAMDRALDQIDEKARWLAAHPVGSNYEISHYREILPVVVSPFCGIHTQPEPTILANGHPAKGDEPGGIEGRFVGWNSPKDRYECCAHPTKVMRSSRVRRYRKLSSCADPTDYSEGSASGRRRAGVWTARG